MTDRSLPKSEIMRGEIAVSRLFSEGGRGFCYPFRYIFRITEGGGAKALVSVPKKNFKKAVVRNLLKRRTKEAYRLNKSTMLGKTTEAEKTVELALIYSSKDIHDYKTINNGVKRVLAEIVGRL